MVSSDTWVGIIGAVVLFLALAGVFIYEANSAQGAGGDGEAQSFAVTGSGTSTYTPANPMTALPNDDVPQSHSVSMVVQGLPTLAGGDLYYAAFFVEGSTNTFIDTLSAVGGNYSLEYEENANHQGATGCIITLETSSSPSAPGAFVVGGSIAGNTITISGDASMAGNATASFEVDQAGDMAQVTGTLTDLPFRNGYAYRVWLVNETDAGTTYSAVATLNGTAGNETFDAMVDGEAGPVPADGFDRVLVSLEKASSTRTVPGGFPVFRVDL